MFGLTPWTRSTRAPVPRLERPFGWLPEEFEPLFNRFFSWPIMETPEWPYRYAVTTEEKEGEYMIRFELPGFTPEELKVELVGETLTVEAEHKEPEKAVGKEKEKEEVHVRRVLTLPPEVEVEKAEAVFRNGVLEVHLPRKPEAMARRIEVKS